jgi:hypothetical protein
MKNLATFWITMLFAGLTMTVCAQDVKGNLDQARQAYGNGSLHESRFALQQALADVDQELGKEILTMLPSTLGELPAVAGEDNVTGNTAGITGMYVSRAYRDEQRSIELELIDDSPFLATVNRLLSLPSFMGMGDPNQKRIKIQGYKALLERHVDDSTGVVSYDIRVPFNRSLFTFTSRGFDEEKQVVGLTESLPLEGIVRMTK